MFSILAVLASLRFFGGLGCRGFGGKGQSFSSLFPFPVGLCADCQAAKPKKPQTLDHKPLSREHKNSKPLWFRAGLRGSVQSFRVQGVRRLLRADHYGPHGAGAAPHYRNEAVPGPFGFR